MKKDESSDDMSPPSAMDTSSESDSEMPLSNRLQKEEKDIRKIKVKLKRKTRDENKRKRHKKGLKSPIRSKCPNFVKKPVAKQKNVKSKDSTVKNKNEGTKTKGKRRKKDFDAA